MHKIIYSAITVLFLCALQMSEANAQAGIKLRADDAFREEQFGRGGAIYGDIALIGAPSHYNGGGYSGKVYEFTRQGDSWVLTDSLFPTTVTEGHSFGISIDMDSTFAIIGMMGEAGAGVESGSAFIFQRLDGAWLERQKLEPADGESGDFFGRSVAISGDYALIGAPGDDDLGETSGSAYIYQRQDADWVELTKLLPASGAPGDSFGVVVDLSGVNALVGAPQGDRMEPNSGYASAFQLQEEEWVELSDRLQLDVEVAEDRFGFALAIDSTFALIGAPGIIGDAGASYFFELENDMWVLRDTLIASNGRAGGLYVAMSTRYAFVVNRASIIFQRPSIFERVDGKWVSIPDQLDTYRGFLGGEMAISGQDLLVGAYFDGGSEGSDIGAAYIFDLTKSAPVITTAPITSAELDVPYTYLVQAMAFPAPTYGLSEAPAGMTLDSLNGLIEWLPTQSGEFEIEIVATNSITPADTQRFTIEVAGIAPFITTTPDTIATVNMAYSYQVRATGNPVPIYTLAANPEGMTIEPNTGEIDWIPTEGGRFEVIVLAANGIDPAASQQFDIAVSDPAPGINSVPDTVAVLGQLYVYTVEATGYPAPRFILLQAPEGMDIDSLSGQVSWVPDQVGLFDVEITAVNGIAPADTQRFDIRVVGDTSAEDNDPLPSAFEIRSTYPNPFTDRVVIHYGLPGAGLIRAIVYDALGRQIAALLHTSQHTGEHRLTWEPGAGVMPGIYFVRITTDGGESRVVEIVKSR